MNDLEEQGVLATFWTIKLTANFCPGCSSKPGIPFNRAKFVAVGSHSGACSILAEEADAALVNEVTAQARVRSGKVHIVASVPDYFPKLDYTVLGVRTDSLKDPKKRERLRRIYTRGIDKRRSASFPNPFVVQNRIEPEILAFPRSGLDTSLSLLW